MSFRIDPCFVGICLAAFHVTPFETVRDRQELNVTNLDSLAVVVYLIMQVIIELLSRFFSFCSSYQSIDVNATVHNASLH